MLPPEEMRGALSLGEVSPAAFRAALTGVPAAERDVWLDRVLGLGELPADGPELPRGCVPYLPCSVDALLRTIDLAEIQASDVFVDVGSGVGRAAALTHFATGAAVIGLEVQAALVRSSRELAARLNARRLTFIHGDAVELTAQLTTGTVFFFYCPFSGTRLDRALEHLRRASDPRPLRVCSVDLPLPAAPWLEPISVSRDVCVYRSVRSAP